jgi:hypothetical protein
MAYGNGTHNVLQEVCMERIKQEQKWGEQNWPDFPLSLAGAPTLRASWYGVPTEFDAKSALEERFEKGNGTYADIFVEEIAEAIGASSEEELRKELIQCAAVAVAWIEAIDRRSIGEKTGPRPL